MHVHAMDSVGLSPQLLMACLGDASRFRLVQALIGGARCVTDLAVDVGLSQSCTTRHLQALERRRVVCGARDGKRVMYRLCHEQPALGPLLAWALSPEGGGVGAPVESPEGGADIHREGGAVAPEYVPTDRSAPGAAPSGAQRPVRPDSKHTGAAAAPWPARRPVARSPAAVPPSGQADVAQGPPSSGPSSDSAGTSGAWGEFGGAAPEPAPAEPPYRRWSRRPELEDYLL